MIFLNMYIETYYEAKSFQAAHRLLSTNISNISHRDVKALQAELLHKNKLLNDLESELNKIKMSEIKNDINIHNNMEIVDDIDKKFGDILLIFQYGWSVQYDMVHFHNEHYKQFFTNIVYCGVWSEESKNELISNIEIKYIDAIDDEGIVSPYTCVKDAMLKYQ
eukprot:UN28618